MLVSNITLVKVPRATVCILRSHFVDETVSDNYRQTTGDEKTKYET